jgi:hypothetical protein
MRRSLKTLKMNGWQCGTRVFLETHAFDPPLCPICYGALTIGLTFPTTNQYYFNFPSACIQCPPCFELKSWKSLDVHSRAIKSPAYHAAIILYTLHLASIFGRSIAERMLHDSLAFCYNKEHYNNEFLAVPVSSCHYWYNFTDCSVQKRLQKNQNPLESQKLIQLVGPPKHNFNCRNTRENSPESAGSFVRRMMIDSSGRQ